MIAAVSMPAVGEARDIIPDAADITAGIAGTTIITGIAAGADAGTANGVAGRFSV